MPVDLAPLRRRLDRAETHIQSLERSYRSFSHQLKRNRVIVQAESNREQVARVHFDWKVPDHWGLLVGEVAHHLRATLDNLVWALVLDNGEAPTLSTEFPVAVNGDWFEAKAPRKLAGVSPTAFAAIKAVQPYNRADGLSPRMEPLHLVNMLDIIDKHHVLLVAAAVPGQLGWHAEPAHVAAEMHVMSTFRPLYDGAQVLSFTFAVPCEVPVQVDRQATLQVLISETEQTPYLPFPSDLRALLGAISQVVEMVARAAG